MSYSTYLLLTIATLTAPKNPKEENSTAAAEADLHEILKSGEQRLVDVAMKFLKQKLSPTATFRFEQEVQEALLELGRALVQGAYNQLEPADVNSLPKHVNFEADLHTRLNAKTPQNAWTLFGQIRLWRTGYRPSAKSGDATIFPWRWPWGWCTGRHRPWPNAPPGC